MATVLAKPVTRFAAKAIGPDEIILAFHSDGQDTAYRFHPSDINDLIQKMIIASLQPVILVGREREPASKGGAEKVTLIPAERVAASHTPMRGSVGINITIGSGLKLTFELTPEGSLALAQQIQVSAAKAQAPKSTETH
jgi:hypothetical protein